MSHFIDYCHRHRAYGDWEIDITSGIGYVVEFLGNEIAQLRVVACINLVT